MSKLTFYIDGQKAEISENVSFTRIYRGADNTDVKKNNYSLTVKFPFTYTNQLIFKRTNSLSYKSDFPYQTHECNILSNGVVLVDKGKLVILSTSDAFECAITWDNFDFVGAILNNTTKLGEFLESFNSLDWNYNHYLMSKNYDSIKSNSFGYLLYNDGGGEVGISGTSYFSYPHPLINLNYLINLIFAEYGFALSIPTLKNDFLQKLIIRPNKELDRYNNNVFEAFIDHYPFGSLPSIYFGRNLHISENTSTSPYTPSFGNNSFYFKTFIDSVDGEDTFYINDGFTVPQIYRFRSYTNNTSTLVISDFTNVLGGSPTYLKKWKESDQTYHTLFAVSGNMTTTITAEEGDWFYFDSSPTIIPSCNFKLTITTDIDENYKSITNELKFPSLYHIPTNIYLTVGEIVNEALQLTGSVLTFDVSSDTYYFADKANQNSTAFDLTDYITTIKEITYDTKYIYSKLAQENVFKYLSVSPIDYDYGVLVANENLPLLKTIVDSKFSTSNTQSGGTYDQTCVAIEHTFISGQIYTVFTEQPLHLLWNDSSSSKIRLDSQQQMGNIFDLFYASYFNDLTSLILTGSVRLLKIKASMSDIIFKRVNPKGLVYIKNYGKYYSVIEITKTGDATEFFILELY